MSLFPLADCARLLGIHPKTFVSGSNRTLWNLRPSQRCSHEVFDFPTS